MDLIETMNQSKMLQNIFSSFKLMKAIFVESMPHQYSTTYSPAIMELLIKAGYDNDPRILKGFDWLLSIRQDDGGWALPFRTMGKNLGDAFNELRNLYSQINLNHSPI